MKTAELEGARLVTKEVWNEIKASAREMKQKGVIGAQDAADVLGVHVNTFYQKAKDPETKLRPSKSVSGKYIWNSVKEEFKRIHGVPYDEASR